MENEVIINETKYVAKPLVGKGCDGCVATEGDDICEQLPPCNCIDRADKQSVVFVASKTA